MAGSDANPIVVRDCGDMFWPDTWSLDLHGEALAYVNGEAKADMLAAIINPESDPLQLLDIVILMMTTNIELLHVLGAACEKLAEQEHGAKD